MTTLCDGDKTGKKIGVNMGLLRGTFKFQVEFQCGKSKMFDEVILAKTGSTTGLYIDYLPTSTDRNLGSRATHLSY
jgi:hypothetical protein